jgi:hypothetical protein
MKASTNMLLALGISAVLGGTAIAGPDRTGQSIAFARIDGPTGAVTAVGGAGTKSAVGVRNSAGDYTITFTGHYPKTLTADKVVVNATAESASFGVANAIVQNVSSTQITVEIFTWDSPVATEVDNNCFLTLFLGR